MPLTPAQRDMLESVNLRINAIPYTDIPGAHEPVDWWTDVPVAGESWVCRDYVLAKAEALAAAGWPAHDMTVVLCWTEPPERGYHAVLAVETGDPQPMILDSRFDDIYRMDDPTKLYTWDRRQVAGTVEFQSIA